jgi:arylsulfatase A-like enzyme
MKMWLSLFLVCVTSLNAVGAEKPNLVVFLSDDHTWRDSSVYGSKEMPTPNMARLAAKGMTFDRAYVASPSCAPSRAALLTGLYPARNGAEANHARPRKEIKKLPAYLQEMGYEVVSFGKVGHYAQTPEYGFDLAKHFKYHEDIAVSAALEWLKARESDRPLCLFVGTNWPHVPWPKDLGDLKAEDQTPPPHHVNNLRTRERRAHYHAAVNIMDRELGEVFDLAYAKLGPNTLFIHTSNHGAQWPFGKWTLYDDGIRTPLIATWPGRIPENKRNDALVSWIDLLPTLVEAAGGAQPEGIDGRSMLKVMTGEAATHREIIFTTHSGDGNNNVYPTRAATSPDGWTYIRNLHPEFRFTTHITTNPADTGYWPSWVEASKKDLAAARVVQRYEARPAEELYDNNRDPYQLKNLAHDPESYPRLEAMRKSLDEWIRQTGDEQRVFGEPKLLATPAE